jgi:hypothetical protein
LHNQVTMTDLLSLYFGRGIGYGIRDIMFKHLILPPNDPDVVRVAKQRRRHMKNQKQHSTRYVCGNPYRGRHPMTVAHEDLRMLARVSKFWNAVVTTYRWSVCPNVMHVEIAIMRKNLETPRKQKQANKKYRKNLEIMRIENIIEWIDSL